MYIQSGELVIISGVKNYFKGKLFQSLRFRIIVVVMLAGVLPAFGMRTMILKNYENQAVEARTADIQNQCTILSNRLSAVNYRKEVTSELIQSELTQSEIIRSELTQLSNIYNGRVMIIDQTYSILFDTYGMDEGKQIVSEEVILCFREKENSHYDAKNRYIEVAAPILGSDNDTVEAVILVSVSTDNIADGRAYLAQKTDLVLGVSALLLILLALVSAGLIVRPIQKITESVEAVGEEHKKFEYKKNTYLETRKLAESIDAMMEKMNALDESRKRFVSNVSHELKTPLTSMKVLSDSLLAQEEVPNELYREFMQDLSEEIDRENKIINDLLALTRMEKNENTMNITSENINQLVEQILKRLRPIAELKNVEVIFESFRQVQAEVDEVKLSLAISNLVENAIKYNQEGGWIHVTLNADHKCFYVRIEDSGIGIPEEDLPHIFERFYRVDKSHARDTGGTGLGLAIARSAIVMHRGAVKVFSKYGEGTTFVVRIPLTYAP